MATFTVTTAADEDNGAANGTSLREAINDANSNPGADTITFDASLAGQTIQLGSMLPLIASDMTIDGGTAGITIDGQDQHRIFFIDSGTVTLGNLVLADGLARGGNGGTTALMGGGGGMGAGGAIFVRGTLGGHTAPTVTLDNIAIQSSSAVGGSGGQHTFGTVFGGGGGGLGGHGGGGSPNVGSVGAGHGGGGAFRGDDGLSASGTAGAAGGGPNGGAGGSSGVNGGAGGEYSGGGGSGSSSATGGAGGFGGGGGGGGNGPAATGGSGGFGGGGGGAINGGQGGYGGGAGYGGLAVGAAGFGGGASVLTGNLAIDAGGGGAGMGGGLFVMEGATVTVTGSLDAGGNTATGGSGPGSAGDGRAFGGGMFLQGSGTLNFGPGAGAVQEISNAIEDEAGVIASGYGAPLGFGTPGAWGLELDGDGTLVLSAINSYSGATTVAGGTLVVNGSISNSAVFVQNAGTLGGAGTVGDLTVLSGGTLAPGNSPEVIDTGDFDLQSGSTLEIEIGGTTVGTQYDQVNVTGSVTLGGTLDVSFLNAFDPANGDTFVIVNNDLADDVSGTFAGLAEGAVFVAGAQQFSISYAGGTGNDVVLTATEDASLVVTTLLDVVNAFDGLTSLREALNLANSGGGDELITFDGALDGTIRLSASLTVSDHVTIRGQIGVDGKPKVTISGDVADDDATLTGTDITNIQASQAAGTLGDNVRIIDHSYGFLTLENLVLTGGAASDYGGAVWSHTGDAQQLTATGVTFAGNRAGVAGGAVWTGKEAEFNNTTISGNVAGSSSAANALGGGIFANNVDFENVTISGNSVIGISGNGTTGQGGGVFAVAGIVNSMENVTVTGNYATNNGGGIAISNLSTFVLRSSIVSGNDAGVGGDDIRAVSPGNRADHNIIGTQITDGDSVIGSTTPAAIFAGVSSNPFTGILSGTLADNGGPVQTVALLANALNPALDLGTDDPETDARGVDARDYVNLPNDVSGSGRDLGAYELDVNLPAIARDDSNPINIVGATIINEYAYLGTTSYSFSGTIIDPGIEQPDTSSAPYSIDASRHSIRMAGNGSFLGGVVVSYALAHPDFVFASATLDPLSSPLGTAPYIQDGRIILTGGFGVDQPLIVDFTVGLKEDRTFSGDLFADNGAGADGDLFADNGAGADFDADGDAFSVTHINGAAVTGGQALILPSGARLTIRADGTFDYDTNDAFDALAAGASATESFAYTITGGSTATVSFTIGGLDTAPVAVNDAVATREDIALTGSVVIDNGSGVEFDIDGGAAPVVVAVNGAGGSVGQVIVLPSGAKLSLNADGTFVYDPNGAFDFLPSAASGASNLTAADSFTYTLAGGSTATVTVTLTGIDSDDLLRGTGAADTLRGGVGNDTISAGAGADRLNGGAGADLMRGGNGNDIYYVDDREDVVLEAPGQGVDTVYSTVTRTLGPHIEHLLLQGTADINGGGNDLANQITGNSGANFISGKEGADTLLGMAGNDRLDGGTGIDVMRGGAGDDIYYIGEAGDRTVEKANEGTDTVFSSLTRRLGSHLENLRLLGTDNLNGAGNALDNGLYGNEGANVLRGEGGVDWLEGGGGNDTLDGGVGGDAMRGGTGDDLYKVDDLGDRTVETTAGPEGGIDTVESSVDRSLGDNIENLRLVGSAGISGYGNELANAITGNGGANVLSGREGNDTLTGGGGNDTLSGGEGDDLLIGGRGDDNLNGGAGADTFRFSGAGDGTDTINAFVAAEDRFDLSGSRFTSATQTGTDTRLKHAGGTIIVTGVRGLTLEDWNALVAPSASLAFTAADGASALADPQHDGWTFTPSSPADLFVVMPVDGPLVGHADFV